MRHCEILLPFGLPPSALAGDLLRSMKTPALATLLGKSSLVAIHRFDPFARSLPHEAWLAGRMGMQTRPESSPPWVAKRVADLGQTLEPGCWFLLHPVHIHIARDHLVLTDQRNLSLDDAESRALFDLAKPAFEAAGKPLLYGDAQTWLVRADDWHDLHTASPDAACGHNIDIWMPQGPGERAWRKLQNEVQMEWHEHPINQEREARRKQAVNSLWLWGGAMLPMPQPSGNNDITIFDGLSQAALAEDWGLWLEALQAFDATGLASLLASLKAGSLERLTLYLSHNTELREFTVTRASLWKFWAGPSLAKLAP